MKKLTRQRRCHVAAKLLFGELYGRHPKFDEDFDNFNTIIDHFQTAIKEAKKKEK